jgi:4-hydroxybenzoate polyprenyltransferase
MTVGLLQAMRRSQDTAVRTARSQTQTLRQNSTLSQIALKTLLILRFYRISEWLHFLGFALLGILLAGPLSISSPSHTVMIAVASAGLLAHAYSFNEVFDSELENSCGIKKNLPGNKRSSVILSIIPMFGGLILLSQFSHTVLALGLLFSLLWTMYSYPIPRLKAVPFVSTLVNGIAFPLLFLIGFASVNTPSLGSALFFLALVLLEIPAQLIHETCHSQSDRLLGFKTTVVRYGAETAFQGAIAGMLGVIVLVAIMLTQGFVNLVTALSIGCFASTFAIMFGLEYRRQDAREFQKLRTNYKYGGILTGAIVALSAFL